MTNSNSSLKKGWQIVKFGEIAKNISKRVNPSETDLEVYVGLEHLDPQSFRITRRGVPADVKGQKLRVRPGQIIFGKRRAYQKKLAVADFDGICSAHAMVLEAVPGKIIPELLPFFMQSDMFMDRAVAISEGSLSPTIKWKTLAIQKFPLPPLERQKKILEVLKKNNQIINKTSILASYVSTVLVKIRGNLFSVRTQDFPKFNLSSVADCKGGFGFKRAYQGKKAGDYPFIKVSDMNSGTNTKYIKNAENWLTSEDSELLRVKPFPKGAVVFAKVGAALLLNKRRILFMPTIIDNNMMAAIPNEKVSPEYLYHYFNTIDFSTFVRSGALPSVNQSDIESLKIKLPILAIQKKWSNLLDRIEAISETIKAQLKNSISLQSKIFNSYFSRGIE